MQLTKLDALFAAKAVSKEINNRVKAFEDEVKAEALEQYERDGTDRQRSKLFGNDAGYLTIKEGKPSEHVERFTVTDVQALVDWFEEQRPETDCFVADYIEDFAKWHFEHTGECPDGCSFIQYESEPGRPIPALTVKEKVVLPMIAEDRMLSGQVTNMLFSDGNIGLMLGDGNGSN